jgi:hypothetical protein
LVQAADYYEQFFTGVYTHNCASSSSIVKWIADYREMVKEIPGREPLSTEIDTWAEMVANGIREETYPPLRAPGLDNEIRQYESEMEDKIQANLAAMLSNTNE